VRAIGLLVVLAAPAAAQKSSGITLPDIVKESIETAKLVDPNGALGMDGQRAAGIVIKPPYHPDAEPVHQGGSWIVPPDPNDPMAIAPGTNQLQWRERVEPWLPRDVSRQVKRAADKVWDVLLPKI
jgi:hypothetical protein